MKKLLLWFLGLAAVGFFGCVAFLGWLDASYASRGSRPTADTVEGPPLVVLVRPAELGLRVTNDTDLSWHNCEAEISGGFTQRQSILPARVTVNFPYIGFSTGRARLEEDQGYARAIRGTLLSCVGEDGQLRHARIE